LKGAKSYAKKRKKEKEDLQIDQAERVFGTTQQAT